MKVAVMGLKQLLSLISVLGDKATYVYAMEPVYLVESVPPKVRSPLVTTDEVVVGSKEILTTISPGCKGSQ